MPTYFYRIYGITCLQTYSYYTKCSENDRWPTKFVVAIMWWVIDLTLVNEKKSQVFTKGVG